MLKSSNEFLWSTNNEFDKKNQSLLMKNIANIWWQTFMNLDNTKKISFLYKQFDFEKFQIIEKNWFFVDMDKWLPKLTLRYPLPISRFFNTRAIAQVYSLSPKIRRRIIIEFFPKNLFA